MRVDFGIRKRDATPAFSFRIDHSAQKLTGGSRQELGRGDQDQDDDPRMLTRTRQRGSVLCQDETAARVDVVCRRGRNEPRDLLFLHAAILPEDKRIT